MLSLNILILQKNTGRAGAQNSLRRLLMSQTFQVHHIVVVTSHGGWFVEQVKNMGVKTIEVEFPSSRSLFGKIIGNWVWLGKVVKELAKINFIPNIVQANNHVETPFLMLLKGRYQQAISVVFLRDGYLQKYSYYKYQCHQCDMKIAVSKVMLQTLNWDKEVHLINNGVFENEIAPLPYLKSIIPSRWLIIGNPCEGKGWFDFLLALQQLDELGVIGNGLSIVFTGSPSAEYKKRYEEACKGLGDYISIEFSSQFNNLGKACRKFDLIVSPSHKESFGMAMLEACCSGACVVASRTGIADMVVLNANMLYPPGSVSGLVGCLRYVIDEWANIEGLSDQALNNVKQYFSVEKNANDLLQLYEKKVIEHQKND